jgi:hypothetical protein
VTIRGGRREVCIADSSWVIIDETTLYYVTGAEGPLFDLVLLKEEASCEAVDDNNYLVAITRHTRNGLVEMG